MTWRSRLGKGSGRTEVGSGHGYDLNTLYSCIKFQRINSKLLKIFLSDISGEKNFYICLGFEFLFVKTGSHAAQADFELTVSSRVTLNF